MLPLLPVVTVSFPEAAAAAVHQLTRGAPLRSGPRGGPGQGAVGGSEQRRAAQLAASAAARERRPAGAPDRPAGGARTAHRAAVRRGRGRRQTEAARPDVPVGGGTEHQVGGRVGHVVGEEVVGAGGA